VILNDREQYSFVTVFASVASTALAMKKFKSAIYKNRCALDISITPPRTKKFVPLILCALQYCACLIRNVFFWYRQK
jgi:hypothetical protein